MSLKQFEIIEDQDGEWSAAWQIGHVCAGVELVGGMYVPSVSVDEYGDPAIKGLPMSTPEHAAKAAVLLVHLLCDRIKAKFTKPDGSASVIVDDGATAV